MKRLILFLALFQLYMAADWDYSNYGEDMWKTAYATCNGTRQSPVDIPYDGAFLQYENLGTLTFTGYNAMASSNLELKNNGHTAVASVVNLSNDTYIEGGGLTGRYTALQFHFHWGADNNHGSEHTFRGRMYPLELHIVHYKQDYGDVTAALDQGDGLAVVGIFFEISETDNANLNPILDHLATIVEKDATQTVQIDFSNLFGSATDEFYRYEGSLTTPGCNEAVIWTVLENKNTISNAQLARFRQLKKSAGTGNDVLLTMNYRHVQPLGTRIVKKNYNADLPPSYHWSYGTAADNWGNYYPTCKGQRQSPVNIPGLYSTKIAAFNSTMNLDTLEFHNYDQLLTGTLTNNGHAAQVNLDAETAYIINGGLTGKYVAVQFHFHWGSTNTVGSEHQINGHSFPLEMHIVHYKKEYNSITEALNFDDGLAVVGFMFQVSDSDNSDYAAIISAMDNIPYSGDLHAVSSFSLQQLTIPNLYQGNNVGIKYPFYRYNGGLTTPPCSQVVIWTVMNEPISISSTQLDKFRTLAKVTQADASTPVDVSELIIQNYRPVQDLLLRSVFLSAENMVGQSGTAAPVGFTWGYHGDEGAQNWKYYYTTCEGVQQSPIDLPAYDSSTLVFDATMGLDSLEFINYDEAATGTLKNNGHTIQVDLTSPNLYIQNGGLSGRYQAVQFHFHWGADNAHGSEHTVTGTQYPLELHIVHYKESYGTVTNALNHADGLAVVGFFFQVTGTDNAAYSNIISSLTDVQYKSSSKAISGFNVQDMTFRDLKKSATEGVHYPYYRYMGGLTTPPCSQIVTWSVMNQAIGISSAQLAVFRTMLHGTVADNNPTDFITKNYRPVQPLSGRTIYTSFQSSPSGAAQITSTVGLISALLCLLLL